MGVCKASKLEELQLGFLCPNGNCCLYETRDAIAYAHISTAEHSVSLSRECLTHLLLLYLSGPEMR